MRKISRPAFAFVVGTLLLTLLMQGCGSNSHTQTATHTLPSTIVKNHIRTTSYTLETPQYTTTINFSPFAIYYVSQVKNVAKSPYRYTTSSTHQERVGTAVSLSSTPTPGTNKCKNDLANANWWGITIYLDHCSIVGLGNVKGITTAASGIAVALDAFGIGIPIAVAIGILNIYSGVLAKEDYDCGNNGAYLNVTWLIVAWVAPVC